MSVLRVNLMSKILGGPTDLTVICPHPDLFTGDPRRFYVSGKKYKVLWLLHGGNCDCNSWLYHTNLVRYVKDREFMVVMPSGQNADFANHPQFADGLMLTDFFFEELMPFVHGWLPTSSQKEDNFVAGYSMGAAAAWMFGLYCPESFGKLFSLGSPPKNYAFMEEYRNWSGEEFREKALADPLKFPAGYGDPKAGIHLKEVNMIAKYGTVGDFLDSCEHTGYRVKEAAENGNMPEAYLLCDTGERTYQKVKEFQKQAEAWKNVSIHFEYTDLSLREYAFCDNALQRILEICAD